MRKQILTILTTLLLTTAVFGPVTTEAQNIEGNEQQEVKPKVIDKRKNASYFSKGLEYKIKGDFQGAITQFETALEFLPTDAASMYELSFLYAATDREIEAFELIKKAVEYDNENKWYKLYLAQFYKNMEMYDEYITLYEELIRLNPGKIEYLAEIIDVQLIVGDYEGALAKLNELETILGFDEFTSLQKVDLYKKMEKNKEAIKELENIVKMSPNNTKIISTLAQLHLADGNKKEALKCLLKVKEINPDDPYISISLLEFYQNSGELDKAYDELLNAIRNKNLDFNIKLDIYDYWVENGKNDDLLAKQTEEIGNIMIETHPDKGFGYLILGNALTAQEKYTEAKHIYASALTLDSTNYLAWKQLLYCNASEDDNDAILDNAQKALHFFPEQPLFYWYAAVSSSIKDNNNDAIKYLEIGRKFLADKNWLVMFDSYLGDLYHIASEKAKAYQAYDRALHNDPDNITVLNNYAYYLALDNNNLEKALKMSARTIELEPQNPMYIDTYAWVFYKMQRYEDAEKWMKKALNMGKDNNGTYLEHYGDILFQLNKKNDAVNYWKKAKKAGNTSNLIDKKIKDETLYEE